MSVFHPIGSGSIYACEYFIIQFQLFVFSNYSRVPNK
jgi:hypothetical protein